MRTREFSSYQATDAYGRPEIVKMYEICVPDDFHIDTPPAFHFAEDCMSFAASETITRDLTALRAAQLSNPLFEFGTIRINRLDAHLSLNTILQGTESSVATKLLPKALYEGKGELLSKAIPFQTTDDFHTHTVAEGVEPNISNLFSAMDILTMGATRSRRSWMIGIDGVANALINPNIQEDRRQFDRHGYHYGEKFCLGYTYDEAFKDMILCVEGCGLLLFRSFDYTNFSRITWENPPYHTIQAQDF